MGARYYQSLPGRFTGIDPVDFQPDNIHSFNRYTYANNNPYKYVEHASQAQMGEKVIQMAGEGVKTTFRDASRIAADHGGNAKDWVKKTSTPFTSPDGKKFETNWVENLKLVKGYK